MKNIRLVIFIFVGLLLSAKVVLANPDFRWAYVDVQKAVRAVDRGKGAYNDLVAMKEKLHKELKTEEKNLVDESESLKKQEALLSEEAKRRKGGEFAQKQMEFQRKVEKYEMDLMKTQNDYAKDILQDMSKIIEDMGKDEKLDAIFERSASSLLFADATRDMTDKVIARYNKLFPVGGKKGKK